MFLESWLSTPCHYLSDILAIVHNIEMCGLKRAKTYMKTILHIVIIVQCVFILCSTSTSGQPYVLCTVLLQIQLPYDLLLQ